VYTELTDLAEDLIACPASQAYVERVFSICGMLSAGRRNRMTKSLQMRASLQFINAVLSASGFKF
jgi:hAT family C-terminal dimerisation region